MCTHLEKTDKVTLDYVDVDEFGGVNLSHLEELLSISNTKTLVAWAYSSVPRGVRHAPCN